MHKTAMKGMVTKAMKGMATKRPVPGPDTPLRDKTSRRTKKPKRKQQSTDIAVVMCAMRLSLKVMMTKVTQGMTQCIAKANAMHGYTENVLALVNSNIRHYLQRTPLTYALIVCWASRPLLSMS